MKKREQGILTVEASLVLGMLVLFVLFIFSFARIYRAQSVISHAVIQASDAVAMESYLRETSFDADVSQIANMANKISGSTTLSESNLTSLRSAHLPDVVKQKFTAALSDTENEAVNILKSVGVKDGLDGVNFAASYMDLENNDVVVYANYTLKMQFPVFGVSEIKLTKAARSKTFGEILFEIQTLSEDVNKGTASGGGNYKQGTKIQIIATSNYGYKFVSWNDGNTENPRTVTVTGATTYTAKFTEDQFGVTVKSSPTNSGTVSGGGVYSYLSNTTVTATANAGYTFNNWVIYSHKDRKNTVIYAPQAPININQSYTCTAYFNINSYNVSVSTEGASNGASLVYNSKVQNNVTLPYKTAFKLSAATLSGYDFLGWKEAGASNYLTSAKTLNLTVPARNVSYVACYKPAWRTVTFYNYNGSVYTTRTVTAGTSLGGNMPGRPYNSGMKFNGWNNFSANTIVYSDTFVSGNWSRCTKHKWGHCGQKHYFGYWTNWHWTTAHRNECELNWAACQVCVYCGHSSYRVYCGNNKCSSWRKYEWVNIHGLSHMEYLWN